MTGLVNKFSEKLGHRGDGLKRRHIAPYSTTARIWTIVIGSDPSTVANNYIFYFFLAGSHVAKAGLCFALERFEPGLEVLEGLEVLVTVCLVLLAAASLTKVLTSQTLTSVSF